eukprot:scaffold1959_cov403-Prasinococcus_capsulatus_cf.AAC.8
MWPLRAGYGKQSGVVGVNCHGSTMLPSYILECSLQRRLVGAAGNCRTMKMLTTAHDVGRLREADAVSSAPNQPYACIRRAARTAHDGSDIELGGYCGRHLEP